MATMITGDSKVKKYDLKSVWFSDITDQALFGVKTEHPSYDVFILFLGTSKTRLWKWLSFRSLEAERRYSFPNHGKLIQKVRHHEKIVKNI